MVSRFVLYTDEGEWDDPEGIGVSMAPQISD